MKLVTRLMPSFLAMICAFLVPAISNAQVDFQNTVDFDFTQVVSFCANVDPDDPDADPIQVAACDLLPIIVDQLNEAEAFCDQVFVGYREDIPFILRNELVEPVIVNMVLVDIDGAFNVLARASIGLDTDGDGNIDFPGVLDITPPPFLQARRFRSWAIPRFATVEIDISDIVRGVLEGSFVGTIIHEALHSLGHPQTFEQARLNRAPTLFTSPNFVGDIFGPNGVGFGITEYRIESENPIADFVPLSQTDGGAHLSTFEPAFLDFATGMQEVFIPVELGLDGFMSRTLRGMFADMGYRIRGINAPGIIDIDGDSADDIPLFVNPDLPGE